VENLTTDTRRGVKPSGNVRKQLEHKAMTSSLLEMVVNAGLDMERTTRNMDRSPSAQTMARDSMGA